LFFKVQIGRLIQRIGCYYISRCTGSTSFYVNKNFSGNLSKCWGSIEGWHSAINVGEGKGTKINGTYQIPITRYYSQKVASYSKGTPTNEKVYSKNSNQYPDNYTDGEKWYVKDGISSPSI